MLLKKFLNDESKSPVKDFLLWLVVYPFVIVFAVACAINIFQFAIFQNIKFTDWIMAGCTFLILIGTWKAAGYAKKAAHQAQIQNNNAIVSKIDDLSKALLGDLENSRCYIEKIYNECEEQIENQFRIGYSEFREGIYNSLKSFLKLNSDGVLYKYKFFIEHIIGYNKIDNFYSVINKMKFINGNLFSFVINIDDISNENYVYNLRDYSREYAELTDELLKQISDKYQELNGSS